MVHSSNPFTHSPFPSANYVQLVDDPEETLDQGGEKAVALFDFDGSAEDELTFREGDILIDIDQMNGSDWWTGTKESGGQRGLFPGKWNFLMLVTRSSSFSFLIPPSLLANYVEIQ